MQDSELADIVEQLATQAEEGYTLDQVVEQAVARYRLAATIPVEATPMPQEPRGSEAVSGAQHARRNPTSGPAPSSAPRR